MATRFIEVLPNRGVDDNVGPIPQMIVPLRGTNHILLIDGEGLAVQAESPHMLEITEVAVTVRLIPNIGWFNSFRTTLMLAVANIGSGI